MIYNNCGSGVKGVYTTEDECNQLLKISGDQLSITDGNTVTLPSSGGGTWGSITGTLSDQTDLQAAIDAAPSGTGTNLRIPVWTGTNSLGSSTLLQSATGQTLDANLAFQITGGTTASRPTGAAGMMYWNTSNAWWDTHNGTSWFNPARSATTNGLFTTGSVLFGGSDGTIQQDNTSLFFNNTDKRLGIKTPANTAFSGNLDVNESSFPKNMISFRNGLTAAWGITLGAEAVNNVYIGLAGSTTAYYWRANWDVANVACNTFQVANSTTANSTTVMEIRLRGSNTGDYLHLTAPSETQGRVFSVKNSGNVGIGTIAPDRLLHSEVSDAVTNAVTFAQRLSHITSGTATTNFGVGMEYELENASGTNRVAGTSSVAWSDAVDATEDATYTLQLIRAGSLQTAFSVLSTGAMTIGSTMTASAFRISSVFAMTSPGDGIVTFNNTAVNDFNRLQFGGTTSSFPSIKRVSAGLSARLADDSANTTITASQAILDNTVSLASTGGAATAGTLTLIGGTLTVNTTAMTATALLFLQRKTAGGTIGFSTTYTQVNGTSFTVTSDNALDTSTYVWQIVETH